MSTTSTGTFRLMAIAAFYVASVCVAGVYMTGHGMDDLRWVIDSFAYWMPR